MVLVIVAHPDDEALMCGAFIKYLSATDDVHLVVGTMGSYKLEEQKEKINMLYASCEILGIPYLKIDVLDIDDQKIEMLPQIELNRIIEHKIQQLKPTLIITHSENDFNTDHIAINNSVKVATRQYNCTILFFESMYHSNNKLNYYFNATNYFDTKIKAIECYGKYIKDGYDMRSLDAIKTLGQLRGHYINAKYAEAFYLYKTVM